MVQKENPGKIHQTVKLRMTVFKGRDISGLKKQRAN